MTKRLTPVKNLLSGLLLLLLSCGPADSRISETEQQLSTANPNTFPELAELSEEQEAAVAVVYRSVDQGNNWQAFTTGLPAVATVSGFAQLGDELFVTTDFHGVFRTSTDEDQWIASSQGLPDEIDLNCILAVDNRLIIGSFHQGVFVSDDAGHSWFAVPGRLDPEQIRAFHRVGDRVIAGTDNGIFQSGDRADSWQHRYGQMQILGFSENAGKIYAATQDGALLSVNAGEDWEYIYEGDALHDIYHDGKAVYAMTIGRGLLRSEDDGKSWENVQHQMGTFNLYTFEMQALNNQLFAAQWYGIFRSANAGQQWELLSSLPDSTAFASFFLSDNALFAAVAMR
ncbi:MAG: hypothetical protein AAF433_00470 [Bacteroidota bacterium]